MKVKGLNKILMLLCSLLFLAVSCSKEEETPAIEGTWELSDYQTKSVTIGQQEVTVYVEFKAGGTFDIYQKTGSESRFTQFTGSWSFNGGRLSGTYSDGSPWASVYSVSITGDSLVLTSDSAPSEIMTFRKSTLPQGL